MKKATSTLLAITLISLNIKAGGSLIKIDNSAVLSSHTIGKTELFHNGKNFQVFNNGNLHDIPNCLVEKPFRNITLKKLNAFQKIGYFQVKKLENGDFSILSNVRGPGGGPILGAIVYWTVKSVCYAVPVVALGLLKPEDPGIKKAAVGVILSVATKDNHGGVGYAAGIMEDGGLTPKQAAELTVGSVVSAGGVVAISGIIESIATAAGIAAGMAPTP